MVEISVIIPCYNQSKYIGECLDSILEQTFRDYEVVIVNDGSDDDSLSVIKPYISKYDNFRVINQENQGVVAARNRAIAQAKGKYIYPLDADDKIAPTCLQKLYEVISSTHYRVVASNVWTFGKKSTFFEQPAFNKYEMYGKHENCVVSALFYKEDFDAFGGYKMDFNGFGGDDIDYWLNYVDAAYPMIRIPEVLFFYRLKNSDESVWQNYSLTEFKSRQKHKNTLLLHYHPKMRFWAFVYKLTHSFLFRFFWRYKIKNNRRTLTILGGTVYKSDAISY